MKTSKFFSIFFSLLFLCINVFAQDLVEDATGSGSGENVFKETIKIISNSKKIFIITNNSQQLGTGDFLSIAFEDKLAARALVAKIHQGQVGIKILKIYSLRQWGKLKKDLEVQIVKGDDSTFEKPKVVVEQKKEVEESKIKSEEDMFDKNISSKSDISVTEDDLEDIDENSNRNIRPDNILSAFMGFFDADEVESRGGVVRSNELGVSWSYQFADNYFIEGAYGRVVMDNFPGDGTQTLVNHLMARLKYNFKAPLYSFILPYIGFQSYSISSPDAGKTNNQVTNQEELAAVDKLNKTGLAFGVTVLRRLVPGWFLKVDLGTDLMNAGFAIEF